MKYWELGQGGDHPIVLTTEGTDRHGKIESKSNRGKQPEVRTGRVSQGLRLGRRMNLDHKEREPFNRLNHGRHGSTRKNRIEM